MKDFRTLIVWQKAHELTLEIYQVTRAFPKEELFGLTSQIRRSSASTAANIAEGCGRDSNPEFRRFLQVAFGSLNETDYHLLLARDLKLVSDMDYGSIQDRILETKRKLSSLIRKVKTDI